MSSVALMSAAMVAENRLPIDLDAHATTPLAPEALAAMAPFWTTQAANPSSPHLRGELAARAVEQARGEVAALVGADPREIVFTSGATEANAIALLGIAAAAQEAGDPRRRIIVSAIEHSSVEAGAAELARRGWDVCTCPVSHDGRLDLRALGELLTPSTLLVSVMAASNEVGVVQPVSDIAALAHAAGALIHSDLSQIAGRLPFSVFDADLDLASLSAHKLHGPMGVGALFISAATPLRPRPIMFGGAQEGGLRPGTLPTPLIVGFGAAAALVRRRRELDEPGLRALVVRLLEGLDRSGVRFVLNGSAQHRLPGSLNISFPDVDADDLLAKCGKVFSASTGSACSSGQIEPSRVLRAMGLSWSEARSAIRLAFTRYTTAADVDRALSALIASLGPAPA